MYSTTDLIKFLYEAETETEYRELLKAFQQTHFNCFKVNLDELNKRQLKELAVIPCASE